MGKIFGGVLGLVVVGMVVLFITHMNRVPVLDEGVKGAWSQVENQYKRRADLIPNLVSTVKGYAAHEKEVFATVTQARSTVGKLTLTPEILSNPQAFQAFEKAQGALGSALSRLLAVSERYPDLKADKNFLALQSQLEGTENRIAVARRDYIAAVRAYNIELRTIPGKWIAAILYPEAAIKETFSIAPAEKTVPKVSF
jgi:LemA protein